MPATLLLPGVVSEAASSRESFLQTILDHVHDGVYFVDRRRRITFWSRGAERISGYPVDEVLGCCCADNILDHVDGAGCQLCVHGCPLTATMRSGTPTEAKVFLRHRSGHRVPVRVWVTPIRDDAGQVIGAVESFTDRTTQLESERRLAELQRQVLTDPLTGLGNRGLLESRAGACLAEFEAGIPCGALYLDIDHFKALNDRWGHGIGDLVLRMVARTLAANARAEDTVARAGGEEFVVLLQGIGAAELLAKAESLRKMVEASGYPGPEGPLQVTVSIGAAMALKGDTTERWLGRADRALYRAKRGGRNRVEAGAAAPPRVFLEQGPWRATSPFGGAGQLRRLA